MPRQPPPRTMEQLRRQNARLTREVQQLKDELALFEKRKAAVESELEGIPSHMALWFDEDDPPDETELQMKLWAEIDAALEYWH